MIRAGIISLVTLLMLPWLLAAAAWRRARGTASGVLVQQTGKIGDLVCTTPLLRAFGNLPGSRPLDVLCLQRVSEVLWHHPAVSRCVFQDDPAYGTAFGFLRLLLHIHRRRYACCVSVLPGTTSAIVGLWSSALVRLHTRGERAGMWTRLLHLLHTHRLTYHRGTRTYDHYMRIAEACGAPRVPYEHQIFLAEDERAEAGRWLGDRLPEPNARYAVLSLTAGNRVKEWPLDRFVRVARHIRERWGMVVLFSSADTAVTAQAKTATGDDPLFVDAGGLSLRQLAAILERAALFVSVDTGPLYIAHAFGVPVVDIVGPVDPREQPPPPGPRVALVPPPEIRPSSFVAETLREETAGQRAAIEQTTVGMVTEAIDALLR